MAYTPTRLTNTNSDRPGYPAAQMPSSSSSTTRISRHQLRARPRTASRDSAPVLDSGAGMSVTMTPSSAPGPRAPTGSLGCSFVTDGGPAGMYGPAQMADWPEFPLVAGRYAG